MRKLLWATLLVGILSRASTSGAVGCNSTFQCPNMNPVHAAAFDCNGDTDVVDLGEGAGLRCPSYSAVIQVTLEDYDGSGASTNQGILNSDEIQCAIDCLDGEPTQEWNLAVTDPEAISIRAGEIVFLRHVEYRVDQPLHLPITSAQGSTLKVHGYGSILWLDAAEEAAAPTIFERAPDPSWNNADVQMMVQWANGWVFDGLHFRVPPNTTYTNLSKAIDMDGTTHLNVSNCKFDDFGRAIELRFGLFPLIENNQFMGSKDVDIFIGTRCTGCWEACNPCTGRWNGSATQTESGCHHATLRNNHHFTYGTSVAENQTAAVYIQEGIFPVIEGCVFEGVKQPTHGIYAYGTVGNELTLRDTYVEYHYPRTTPSAFFKMAMPGDVMIDGINVTQPLTLGTLYEIATTLGVNTTVRHSTTLAHSPTSGVLMFDNGTGSRWTNTWRFEDVYDTSVPFTSTERWVGGVVPWYVTIDGGQLARRSIEVGELLTMVEGNSILVNSPLRIPLTEPDSSILAYGQIWYDVTNKTVMFCCRDGALGAFTPVLLATVP
jgi:hypothetical protein